MFSLLYGKKSIVAINFLMTNQKFYCIIINIKFFADFRPCKNIKFGSECPLDNRFDENVLKEMQPFLEEHAFIKKQDGSFQNNAKSVLVKYDGSRQMYTLLVADVENGKAGEYSELNAWLFDDSQNAKDAVAVGIDFVASLRKNMGIKIKRTASTVDVELPGISKSGSMTVTGFAKKMLDFFPPLKDEYKNHIAENGNFLYLNFFGLFLVPQIKGVLFSGNKKQIKKLFDLLKDIYVQGDRDSVNTVVAVLCAAAYEDEKAKESICEALDGDSHFLSSFINFLPVFSKNKKLKQTMIR